MIGKPNLNGLNNKISKDKAVELALIDVNKLDFSIRANHVLKKMNIKNLLELALLTNEEIMDTRGCGITVLSEFIGVMQRYGLPVTPICVGNCNMEDINTEVSRIINAENEKTISKLAFLKTKIIGELNFSKRTTNALINAGFTSMYDVALLDYEHLKCVRSLGKKCIDEILHFFEENEIKMPISESNVVSDYDNLKYLSLSSETKEILSSRGITDFKDFKKINDENELYNLLSLCNEEERIKILYELAPFNKIALKPEYFYQYLKYVVDKIIDSMDKSNKLLFTMKFGLYGEEIWPDNILAETLLIDEKELNKYISSVLSPYVEDSEYTHIVPLVNYINHVNDNILFDCYVSVLQKIMEMKRYNQII